METLGFAELSTIVRQQEPWQRQASHLLATRQTQKALRAYDKRGQVHYTDKAHEKLISHWAHHLRASKEFQEKEGHGGCQEEFPRPSALILAYTNQDVQTLNTFARQEARQAGLLTGPDHDMRVCKILNLETLESPGPDKTPLTPKLVYETKPFAMGEPIVFLRNDYALNVRNGQLGRLTHIQEGILTIEKNDGTVIELDVETYGHIDHGYATTIHKSQGATVDKTFVFASPHMNQHLTYVALTRHKEDVHIYADTHLFKNQMMCGVQTSPTFAHPRGLCI
jgi:ATP-dependent exoDNAse (exonuclease V) alpha subunit